MLTVVEERGGTPLAVVRGGRPSKGDTIWLGQSPYCVVKIDRDTVLVRAGGAWRPGTGHRTRNRSLYAVNPGPADYAGYKGYKNPPLDLPKYEQGPSFSPGFTPSPPPTQQPFLPHVAPSPTFEGFFAKPMVFRAYHFTFKFPIFDLSTYRKPQPGEKIAFDGIEYQYTEIGDDKMLVKPTIPWVGFVVAKDKKTDEGLAWCPLTNENQLHGAKQWLKHKIENEQGRQRKEFHLYKKTGHQLRLEFRNNPNARVPVYRSV